MQVVLQTPNQLVVHDGRWSMAVMGALCSAMGGGVMWLKWSHPSGWSGNGPLWLVYVIGGAFFLVGMWILALSADRRYVIDRSAHTVSIIVQRLVHRTTTLLAFRDIDDVALEQSAGMSNNSGGAGSPTFRVVFMMKDGSRVPWTPYSTSARVSQETCAAAARTFGGWAGSPEHQIQPTTPTPALISHPVATNWGCLAAFLSIFVAVGLGMLSLQLYRIATWEPVRATVVSSDVGVVTSSKGNSYKPVVVYNYRYQGNPYQAASVTPISISASQNWAREISARFRAGDVTTAYVNPANPYNAYLLRQVSFIPLIFVLFPVLFGTLYAVILRAQRKQVALAQQHLVPVVNSVSSISARR